MKKWHFLFITLFIFIEGWRKWVYRKNLTLCKEEDGYEIARNSIKQSEVKENIIDTLITEIVEHDPICHTLGLHRCRQRFLEHSNFGQLIGRNVLIEWLARFSDLNLLVFYLHLKSKCCATQPNSIAGPSQKITEK